MNQLPMNQKGKILYAEQDGVHFLKFVGDVRLTLGPTISSFLEHLRSCESFRSMIIDLSETKGIDSTALGLLAKVALCTSESFNSLPSVFCPSDNIDRLLKSMAMDQVCHLVKANPISQASSQGGNDASGQRSQDASAQNFTIEQYSAGGLQELPSKESSEAELLEEVLQAHKTLMNIDDGNKTRFRDLVESLEGERNNE